MSRWLHRQEAKENSFLKRVNTESLKPPTRMKLRKLRQIRFKELKMKSIFRELVLYLVYAVIVSMIGYFARDHSAFLFTRGISEMFTMHLRSSTRPQKEVVYTYKCNETLAFGREKYRNRIGNCSQMTNETERNETVFKVKKMEADDQRTLYPTVSWLKGFLFFAVLFPLWFRKKDCYSMSKFFSNQKILHFFRQNVQSDGSLPPVPPFGSAYYIWYTVYLIWYTLSENESENGKQWLNEEDTKK